MSLRIQFWLETATAALSGLLFILTVAWPDWIERTFGFSPDHGDGAIEWLIVAGLVGLTIALGRRARMSWRRLADASR